MSVGNFPSFHKLANTFGGKFISYSRFSLRPGKQTFEGDAVAPTNNNVAQIAAFYCPPYCLLFKAEEFCCFGN